MNPAGQRGAEIVVLTEGIGGVSLMKNLELNPGGDPSVPSSWIPKESGAGISNVSEAGPPAKSLGAAARTDFADPVTTQYEYIRSDRTLVEPTPRSTPNEPNLKPREIPGLHQAILEKNYKKIMPEDYLRLEQTLNHPERIETTVKDPATGATIWRVENPNTKVTVDIDGKGNVLKVDAPKAPRSETPALNKSNAPRAGPATKSGVDNAGLRDRVLKNIAESKEARLASKVDPYFKAEAVVARKIVANDFYHAAGWSDQRINNHIQGIDFNQPVEVALVKKGTVWTQHGPPNAPTGNYFAEPGTPAKGLGVYPHGTIETTYRAEVDFYALKSKAADITDTWSVKGWNIEVPGGQTQYFVPDTSKLTRIKQ